MWPVLPYLFHQFGECVKPLRFHGIRPCGIEARKLDKSSCAQVMPPVSIEVANGDDLLSAISAGECFCSIAGHVFSVHCFRYRR